MNSNRLPTTPDICRVLHFSLSPKRFIKGEREKCPAAEMRRKNISKTNWLRHEGRKGEIGRNLHFSLLGHAEPKKGEREKNPLGFSLSPFRGGRKVSGGTG